MPLLSIETNVSFDEEDNAAPGVLASLSQAVAAMLGKPEQYVMVNLKTGQDLFFAGSGAPAAYVQLKSLGLPEDKTADYSHTLCELINRELGIPADRIYIEFSSPARHMWGWNNTTF